MLHARRQQQRDEYERDLIHAWNIERMHLMAFQKDGSRQLPDLRKVLNREQRSPNSQDMATMLHAIGDLYGLKVRVTKAKG